MGYGYDFSSWENSDYKYLLVVNTLPYTWANRKWAAALPHWTVNEFFKELEKLLLCEFDIDHAKALVTCSVTSENVGNAGTCYIDKVIDAYSVEVSTDEDKDGYKPMLNQGFAEGGHRLDNIYNAQWYIDKKTRADGTVTCTEWPTLQDLFNSNLPQDSVSDTGGGRSDYAQYPGGKWGLHHVQDIDTYFVLEVMKRVEYRTTPFTIHSEHMKWGNVCRLVPVNRFGPVILDKENEDDVEEMGIIPAWIDETDETYGNVVFLDCGESGDDDTNSARRLLVGRLPAQQAAVAPSVDGHLRHDLFLCRSHSPNGQQPAHNHLGRDIQRSQLLSAYQQQRLRTKQRAVNLH